MNRFALILACACCIIGCGEDDDSYVDVRYFVRNDTTISVSICAVSPETTLTYPDILPGERVQVGRFESPSGEEFGMQFFHSDSVVIKRGDTLLDTYRPWESRPEKHIMARSHYEETLRTERDIEYTFRLFSE